FGWHSTDVAGQVIASAGCRNWGAGRRAQEIGVRRVTREHVNLINNLIVGRENPLRTWLVGNCYLAPVVADEPASKNRRVFAEEPHIGPALTEHQIAANGDIFHPLRQIKYAQRTARVHQAIVRDGNPTAAGPQALERDAETGTIPDEV